MLTSFVRAVEAQHVPVLGIRVWQKGSEIARHDFEPEIRLNIYSASKSYTATAFGIAMKEGLISPEERVVDVFADAIDGNVSPKMSRLRLKHLLNMSSGMDRPYLMGGERPFLKETDWIAYCLTRPVVYEPGTRFLYNNADPYLIGRAVQKRAGCDLVHYLQPRLFAPMGIPLPTWETDPEGYTFGAGGLFLTVDDLCKLGQLYLNGGAWEGRQIVAPEFVREIRNGGIATGSPREDSSRYSCFFWKDSGTVFRADGKYNQFSIVLPEKEAVIAVTAFVRGEGDLLALLREHVAEKL